MTNKRTVPVGCLCITPTARDTFTCQELLQSLNRFLVGDWGDCDPEDRRTNDRALINGGRLLAVYSWGEDRQLWIITEADRSVTTLLLPSDY